MTAISVSISGCLAADTFRAYIARVELVDERCYGAQALTIFLLKFEYRLCGMVPDNDYLPI